jgi:uncharacterized membrane protein (DUF485 family)
VREFMANQEEQNRNLAEVVRKRKRFVTLSSIPFFVLAAVALLSRITAGRFLGIPFSVAGPLAYMTFLATLVLHIAVWRCPACNGHLGVVGRVRFCPKCGTRFDRK